MADGASVAELIPLVARGVHEEAALVLEDIRSWGPRQLPARPRGVGSDPEIRGFMEAARRGENLGAETRKEAQAWLDWKRGPAEGDGRGHGSVDGVRQENLSRLSTILHLYARLRRQGDSVSRGMVEILFKLLTKGWGLTKEQVEEATDPAGPPHAWRAAVEALGRVRPWWEGRRLTSIPGGAG